MERIRKPFQGVVNIIRFNRHFYFLSAAIILLMQLLKKIIAPQYYLGVDFLCLLILVTILVSLLVSFYVYDLSCLYTLNWLDKFNINPGKIVNINAGFDETSALLNKKYPNTELTVFDFYDPAKHTEISIKRAREAYPPYKNTRSICTAHLPLQDDSLDTAFIILSAHEIRNDQERVVFFKEVNRALKHTGKIIVTEHLRDWPNFLAYNIGYFHFLSKRTWNETFKKAGLKIFGEIKITVFITTYILEKNGAAT